MPNRRQEIAQTLVEIGSISIKAMADAYGVSTETIRNDVLYLEKMGIAKRMHGGATYINEVQELPFSRTTTLNKGLKNTIAKEASRHIKGHVVILDSGSTTLALAKLLSLQEGLTVITNSVSIIPILASVEGIHLILTGGEVRPISQDQVGSWATRNLQDVSASVSFIGANSINFGSGPSTSTLSEVDTKRAMIQAGQETYLLVDSTKLEVASTFKFAVWKDFTSIITDSGISDKFVREVSPHTRIIIAP